MCKWVDISAHPIVLKESVKSLARVSAVRCLGRVRSKNSTVQFLPLPGIDRLPSMGESVTLKAP